MLSDSEGEGVPTGPARFMVELLPFLDDTAFQVVLELGVNRLQHHYRKPQAAVFTEGKRVGVTDS